MAAKVGQKVKAGAVVIRRVGGAALTKAKEALAKANTRVRALGKNTAGKGGSVVTVLEVVGGGASAGAIKVYYPEVMGIDTRIIAGGAMLAAGLLAPISPKIAGHIMAVGSGIAAGYAQDMTEDILDGDGAAAPAGE